MPTPFVADAADEAVRSNSILNERKATDIIEETALEVDIRAWRAEGLRLLAPCVASQRSSGQAMPPKNRKSAAFSKVHRCHRLAAAATQMQAARQSVELLVVFARSRVVS